MKQNFDQDNIFWIHEPKAYTIKEDKIVITTEAGTDYWQKTYYGFQNDNAPSLLMTTSEQYFSFLVRTDFDSKHRFDQCGVIIYQNSDNWIKASIEYENEKFQRLGSVVTNLGYSDWATTDIPASQTYMYYRLSRRGSDFCIENSYDGISYQQMRIAHLFEGNEEVHIGIYACSPEESSFHATFTDMKITDCQWEEHK